MNFGVSIMFGWYTSEQFESMVTKMISLLLSVMAVIMVFFSGSRSEIIKDEANRVSILVATISACAFATLAMLDALARTWLPGLRIFAETCVVSGYACIWSMVFMIFRHTSHYLMVPGVGFGLVGFSLLSFMYTYDRERVRGAEVDARLPEVLNRLGRRGDRNSVLHLSTIVAILLKPEDPATALLMEAVRLASPEVLPLPTPTGDYSNPTDPARGTTSSSGDNSNPDGDSTRNNRANPTDPARGNNGSGDNSNPAGDNINAPK
ncbi:unnamed protein product [Brassica rapa subsp. narinosa]